LFTNPIRKQDTVEVVDLMLDNARRKLIELLYVFSTIGIEVLELDPFPS